MPGGRPIPPFGRGRMVEARLTRGPLPRAWTLAAVAAAGLSSVGCTMCPDPFDYSGPVPNGSSPQNDFRARSNGILPLGAAPRPWPLIVKNGGDRADGPQENDPRPTLADASAVGQNNTGELQQTMAVVGESEDEAGMAGRPEAVPETVGSAADTLEPVPVVELTAASPAAAEEEPEAEEELQAEPQPPEAPFTPPVQVGETPGWRTRLR
jgi:hypothetical protein